MFLAYLWSVIIDAERRLYLKRATRCIHLFCIQLFKTSTPGPGRIIIVPHRLSTARFFVCIEIGSEFINGPSGSSLLKAPGFGP